MSARANVVLPVPSSPESVRRSPGPSHWPTSAASAIVEASSGSSIRHWAFRGVRAAMCYFLLNSAKAKQIVADFPGQRFLPLCLGKPIRLRMGFVQFRAARGKDAGDRRTLAFDRIDEHAPAMQFDERVHDR